MGSSDGEFMKREISKQIVNKKQNFKSFQRDKRYALLHCFCRIIPGICIEINVDRSNCFRGSSLDEGGNSHPTDVTTNKKAEVLHSMPKESDDEMDTSKTPLRNMLACFPFKFVLIPERSTHPFFFFFI